jgi:hypothetical protein
MRETIIANVRSTDLPDEWQIQAHLAPGERVDVVIRPSRVRAVRQLRRIAASVSQSARLKGLTARKLERLLDEAKAARRR